MALRPKKAPWMAGFFVGSWVEPFDERDAVGRSVERPVETYLPPRFSLMTESSAFAGAVAVVSGVVAVATSTVRRPIAR